MNINLGAFITGVLAITGVVWYANIKSRSGKPTGVDNADNQVQPDKKTDLVIVDTNDKAQALVDRLNNITRMLITAKMTKDGRQNLEKEIVSIRSTLNSNGWGLINKYEGRVGGIPEYSAIRKDKMPKSETKSSASAVEQSVSPVVSPLFIYATHEKPRLVKYANS